MKRLFSAAAILLTATTFAPAQTASSPIKITGIAATLEKTPEFSIGIGPQRKAPSQDWLWVEVAFTYNGARDAQVIPELTLNYYILLNNTSAQNRTGTLLTGSVTHVAIVPGTDAHHSVMLVSPQTLKAMFGRIPANANLVIQAVGVTATVQGQLVDEQSIGKGKGLPQWWNKFQQGPPGLVLTKDQTPFAPLFYDYFEATKAKAAN